MEPDNLACVKKILTESNDILCNNLEPGDILRKLKAKGAIKPADVAKIKKETTSEEQVDMLLEILQKKPVSAYDVFMGILKEEREDLYQKVKIIEAKHNYKQGGATAPHTSTKPVDLVEPDCNGLYKDRIRTAPVPTADHRNPEKCYTSLLTQGSKGLAYILNIHKFSRGHPERLGSLEDFENMKHLFEELGYHIVAKTELTAQQINESIDEFVDQIRASPDIASSVVVLMSHGDDGIILGKDGQRLTLRSIENKFKPDKCPTLSGKPKLFFIQACRGRVGETLVQADSGHINEMPLDLEVEDVTNNADIFTAFATTEGFFSLRNQIKGSWFVQAIVEVFLAGAERESLHQLMNQVTNRVTRLHGRLYDQATDSEKNVRQTPQIKHTLRKDVYFHPKYSGQ